MQFLRKFLGVTAAVSLFAATTLHAAEAPAPAAQTRAPAAAATPAANQSPLPPGGAAGIRQAQALGLDEIPWVFIVGGTLVLTAVVLGLTHQNATVNTSPPAE
jgi:hypothetical protein